MEVRIVAVFGQRFVVDVATLEIVDVYRPDGKPVDYSQGSALLAVLAVRRLTR